MLRCFGQCNKGGKEGVLEGEKAFDGCGVEKEDNDKGKEQKGGVPLCLFFESKSVCFEERYRDGKKSRKSYDCCF